MITRQQRYSIELLIVSNINGIYFMIVIIILYFLVLSRHELTLPRKITFGITVIMYLLSTICLACVFAQSLLPTDSTTVTTFGTTIGVTNVIFAEFIILWRVWVVWNRRRWIVVLPTISICISTGLGYYSALKSSNKRFGDIFQVISLLSIATNNVISTVLISGRIWYLHRKITKAIGRGRHYSRAPIRIVSVVIESGALYSGLYICGILLFKWSSVAVIIILAILTQMAGVLPAMIMLLVHLDMVPGSQVNQEYNDIINAQSQRENVLPVVLDIRREISSASTSSRHRSSGHFTGTPPDINFDTRPIGISDEK